MLRKYSLLTFLLALSLATAPQIAVVAQSVEQLFKQGLEAEAAKKYTEAEAIWRRVITLEPNNAEAYFHLGKTLGLQNKIEEAEEKCQQAININANYAPAYNCLGNVFDIQGNPEKAIAAYEKAIAIDPNYPDAYNNLGNVLGDRGKLTEAIDNYRRAIALYQSSDPDAAVAYNNLGLTLSDQGNLTEAIASYKKAIAIDPNYPDAYHNLGIALFDQGELEEAITYYRKALSLPELQGTGGSTHKLAHNALGYALQKQGKLEEAIAEYEKAIALDANFITARNNLTKAKEILSVLQSQPSLETLEATQVRFFCAVDRNNTPTTYAQTPNGAVPIFKFVGNYFVGGNPIQTCQKVAARMNKFYEEGKLNHLTSGTVNGQPVICAGTSCDLSSILIVLMPNQSPDQVLKEIESTRTGAGGPVYLSSQPSLNIDDKLPTIKENIPTPEQEPLIPVLRAVVQVIADIPTGINKGTGWVVKREGNTAWIVTCRHVVFDPDRQRKPSENIEVEWYSEPPPDQFRLRMKARIVYITSIDQEMDLAVLEVKDIPDDIQPLTLATTRTSLDADIRIIGHPVTGHPWSRVRSYIAARNIQELQLDATLAAGNSGGPVLNEKNEVIGLVYEISNRETISDNPRPSPAAITTGGFGFAHPIELVRQQMQKWGVIKN